MACHPPAPSSPLVALLYSALLLAAGPSPALGLLLVPGGNAARGGGNATGGDAAYSLTETAERLWSISVAQGEASAAQEAAEAARLQAAIARAASPKDKELLAQAAEAGEAARLESQLATARLLEFAGTLKQAMGTTEAAESCRLLACGAQAFCREVEGAEEPSARCRCFEGYEGNGFVCRPPSKPAERPLFEEAPKRFLKAGEGKTRPLARPPRLADAQLATLADDRVALVYRDSANGHQGFLLFGQVGPSGVQWQTPILFSNGSKAYGPTVVELQQGETGGNRSLAIAYRDENRGGSAFLLAGGYDAARNSLSLGPARAFARHQAQQMALVPLPGSHVAVLFAEHSMEKATGKLETGAMFGSAVLARARADNFGAEVLAKRRFTSGPVARITATLVSPTVFLVAFRQAEDTSGGEKAEASCALAQLHGGELLFNPRALSLEPNVGQVWARGLASLGNGVVAYSYHSGLEQLTKQALLRVDPKTLQLSLLRPPQVIGRGFTPYISSVSTNLPLLQHRTEEQQRLHESQGARFITYFSTAGDVEPKAQLCRAGASGLPERCQELSWAQRAGGASSVAGAATGDGRFLFVAGDARHEGSYQLVGAMDPL